MSLEICFKQTKASRGLCCEAGNGCGRIFNRQSATHLNDTERHMSLISRNMIYKMGGLVVRFRSVRTSSATRRCWRVISQTPAWWCHAETCARKIELTMRNRKGTVKKKYKWLPARRMRSLVDRWVVAMARQRTLWMIVVLLGRRRTFCICSALMRCTSTDISAESVP